MSQVESAITQLHYKKAIPRALQRSFLLFTFQANLVANQRANYVSYVDSALHTCERVTCGSTSLSGEHHNSINIMQMGKTVVELRVSVVISCLQSIMSISQSVNQSTLCTD